MPVYRLPKDCPQIDERIRDFNEFTSRCDAAIRYKRHLKSGHLVGVAARQEDMNDLDFINDLTGTDCCPSTKDWERIYAEFQKRYPPIVIEKKYMVGTEGETSEANF